MTTVCLSQCSHLCSNSVDFLGKASQPIITCCANPYISVFRKHSNKLPPPSSCVLLDSPPLWLNSSLSLDLSAVSFILFSVLISEISMTPSTQWKIRLPWLSANSTLPVSEMQMRWQPGSSLPFQVNIPQ